MESTAVSLASVRGEADRADVQQDAWCHQTRTVPPLQATHDVLDAWANRPRSTWRSLAEQRTSTSAAQRDAYASARLILDGVIAHHVAAIDAWRVRDLADTAWYCAPDNGVMLSEEEERSARDAVAGIALAALAREWLSARDFIAITAQGAA